VLVIGAARVFAEISERTAAPAFPPQPGGNVMALSLLVAPAAEDVGHAAPWSGNRLHDRADRNPVPGQLTAARRDESVRISRQTSP